MISVPDNTYLSTELRVSADRYRDLFENSLNAIALHEIVMDTDGRPIDYIFLEVNPAFEKFTGLSTGQVVGKRVTEVLPGIENDGFIEIYGQVALTGKPIHFEQFATPLNKYYEITAFSPCMGRFAVIFTDITERKQAEALTRIAARLNAPLDLTAVLRTVCEETARALEVQVVDVLLYNPHSGNIALAANVGLPPEYRERFTPVSAETFFNYIDRDGPVAWIEDVQTRMSAPNRELMVEFNIRSVGAGYMMRAGAVIGILAVLTTGEPRHFHPAELSLLKGLADQAAQAILNAQLFENAERRLSHMQGLREIDRAIAGSFDLQITLNVIIEQVLAQLKVSAVDILLLNADINRLEYAAGRGFYTAALKHTHLSLGESYAGRVALERRTWVITDLKAADEFARSPFLTSEGFETYYGVPLVVKGKVVGVLEIFHRAPLQANVEWLDFLEALAGQAAIAIDSTHLFNGLQRSHTELTQAYDATIEGWTQVLDLRDKETEGHTQRVTEMTIRLAQALGLSNAELVHIRRGALLHDIGKMGIPDSILYKPGPLTEAEWAIMRKHPVYAFEMLSPIGYLRLALDIPCSHHEKWDGAGYPRGLKGEAIPLAARIFAVADVWDALRSDRPYRAGWPDDEVREYIRLQSGKHFDPHVVDVFLTILDN